MLFALSFYMPSSDEDVGSPTRSYRRSPTGNLNLCLINDNPGSLSSNYAPVYKVQARFR